MEEDKSAQEEEIMALRSIYEEEDMFSFDSTNNAGTFYVKITAPESTSFNLKFGMSLHFKLILFKKNYLSVERMN